MRRDERPASKASRRYPMRPAAGRESAAECGEDGLKFSIVGNKGA